MSQRRKMWCIRRQGAAVCTVFVRRYRAPGRTIHYVECLYTNSLCRRQGLADQLMKRVTHQADRKGWELRLRVRAFDLGDGTELGLLAPHPDDEQLKAWYRKHGFVESKRKPDVMIRVRKG